MAYSNAYFINIHSLVFICFRLLLMVNVKCYYNGIVMY